MKQKHARVVALTSLAVLISLSLITYWLFPFLAVLKTGSTLVLRDEVERYPEFEEIKSNLTSYVRGIVKAKPINLTTSESGTHPISPLVFVEFIITARSASDGSPMTIGLAAPGMLRVRVDRLIWMLAGTILLGLGTYFLQIIPWKPSSEAPPNHRGMDFLALMEAEISRLTEIGDRLYLRSRLLLIAGVLVAFSGVGALFFLIPNHFLLPSERLASGTDKELLRDLQALLKASGLVLQVEVFAFVLLRQHRSAFGDYTEFHSLRQRYVHYLAASKAMEEKGMQAQIGPQTGVYMAHFLLGGDGFSPTARKPPGSAKDGESDADGLPFSPDKLFSDLRPPASRKTTPGNGGTT